MKRIPCKHGTILVDDEDFDEVSKYSWHSYRDCRSCYAHARVNHKYVQLHRFIMRAEKGQQVDHVNGNGLDCRRRNLRFCSQWQNCFNRVHASRMLGVRKSPTHRTHPWGAYIEHGGKTYFLGRYSTKVQAAAAHDGAARLIAAEFAKMNVGRI